jgi:WD40 repeat protein
VADVFLSYSRRDSEFVSRLAAALQERGKEAWVDVEGVRDAEVFPEALRRAIESSDAFAFVISPDAVKSSFCVEEIEHAASLNKRIVPLALRPVADESLPEEVRFRNWIPVSEDGDLGGTADRLVKALDTDLEWEREHSRLTVRALEWDRSGRDRSSLLRGSELGNAEAWLATGADKDPGPTALETEYLVAARRAAARRQRSLVIGSLVVAAVAIALLIFALISRGDAVSARNTARAQALTSDAERVGAQSLVEKNLDRAMLLGVLGVKLQDRVQTRSDLLAVLQKNFAAIREFRPTRNKVTGLAVSPDEELLAVGDDAGVVRFENLRDWRPSGPAVRLRGGIARGAMSFTAGGRLLLVLTTEPARTNLYAIDVARRTTRRVASWPGVVPAPPASSASLAVEPGGSRAAVSLAIGSPAALTPVAESLLLVDLKTGRTIWRRKYPLRKGQWEAHVAFAPDGELVTSAEQGDTYLWNARTGHIVRRYGIGGRFAISPDGSSLALALNSPTPAIANSRISILDLHSGSTHQLASQVPGAWMIALAFTPDDRHVVGADFTGDVFIWDIATGAIDEKYASQPGARLEMTMDDTGTTVFTGADDGSVAAYDLGGHRRLGRAFTWNVPNQSCPTAPCIVLNPQSTLMATDQGDGSIALIDLHTLGRLAVLPARNGPVANAIAFSPDGRTLATGGVAGTLTLWNVSTRSVLRVIKIGQPVWWTAMSPDGRLLAIQSQRQGSAASQVEVRPVTGGPPRWTHDLPNGNGGLYFSPNGRMVAALGCCAPGSTVAVWNARTGAQLLERSLVDHATAIAFSPDSRTLGLGTESGQLLFWNARTGAPRAAPIHAANGNIDSVSFSPDGSVVAAGSYDRTATAWDLGSHRQIGNTFPEQTAAAPGVLFQPNGRLLIDYLANAAQWPMNVQRWERFACQVAGRDLSRAEWRQLLPTRPYMRVCPASSG